MELRDGGSRYGGKGVARAVANVNGEIAEILDGFVLDQRSIDFAMIGSDGTTNKSRLGANAILGASLAMARRRPTSSIPLFRSVGGADAHVLPPHDERHQRRRPRRQLDRPPRIHDHASGRRLVLRVAPMGGRDVHWPVLKNRGLSTAVGDEVDYAPDLDSNEQAVQVLVEAIEAAGRVPGDEIAIAMDPATSELFKDGHYVLAGEGRTLTSSELVDYWIDLCGRYPIVSIEDGMAEEDWDGWALMTAALGERIQLVGDDVFDDQRGAAPARYRSRVA